jgi:hypothetical protein
LADALGRDRKAKLSMVIHGIAIENSVPFFNSLLGRAILAKLLLEA